MKRVEVVVVVVEDKAIAVRWRSVSIFGKAHGCMSERGSHEAKSTVLF